MMLQRLRDKAQGWFAWVILGAIAVTFVLFGTSNYFTSGPDNTIAKVNGASISEWEVEQAYQRLLRSPGNEGLRHTDPDQIKKEVLEGLIEERILLQSAKKLGLTISNERINLVIMNLPFTKNEKGEFSQEAYLQFLAQSNFTDHSFREYIRDNLVLQQLQRAIAGTAFSLTNDVQDYIKFAKQKRDFRIKVLDKQLVQNHIAITDDEIKQYYDTHLANFMIPEKISLEYIQLSLNDLLNKVEYSDHDLQAFYRDNLSAFTIPASAEVKHILIAIPKEADATIQASTQEKVSKIQQALKSGESFESLAQEYSDDKSSAEKGGELSWFVAGEMVPEFEKAAFALNPNQVSEPVRTEFGYHFIKMVDKKPQRVKPLFEVKQELIDKYKRYQAEEKLAELTDELAQVVFDTSDSLQPAADKLGKPIVKTPLFAEGELQQDPLLNQPEVLAAAFSSTVKDDKNNSDVIKLDDENYVVLRVADLEPAKQKPLDNVKSEIARVLEEQKVEAQLKEKAETEIASIKENPTQQNEGWEVKNDIGRTTRNIDQNLLEAVFAMPRLQQDQTHPELKSVKLSNGDYAIIWLTGIVDGSLEGVSQQEIQNIQTELQAHWGRLEFALYATDQIDKAKIKRKAA